ncbi:hypothetical protein COCON_G00162030 [Conger conger]|uniref:Starch-binding domain-containing protein 1 n=1 Tax=Conger conger TaxID=82655 RepID=A0A9Q1HTA3_CONCO|nr:hypothetical protein COCON_G00162030 [Conger conger]
MTSEQSKPIALDERDVHLFFHMFGRYEPAVALGVIVMLSVWALFNILHRTIRGQRRKKDENALETEVRAVEKMTIEEQQHCHTKSTVSENLREEKNTHGLDSSRSCREEQTCRITEINAMETTVKSHQEDYQHLREHCEHLSNFHYHGLLSSLHERESDRHRPPSDLPRLDAVGEVSESKTKTLKSGTSQPPEDNGEKTEINIMEATMDYNEWMNSSTAEMNKSIGWSGKIMNGTADVGIAEQCIQKLADYNLAKISITKESGTTCTLLDSDPAAVQPTTQTVAVSFCVHYITDSSFQLLAVTGNQQELGDWKEFVPLRRAKDGFWVSSVDLPADVHVEWKFVVVENGRIHRWEECSNRHLETGCENVIHLHKWWGCV